MKYLSGTISLLAGLIAFHSNAQTCNPSCDTIYKKVDKSAVYKNGMTDILLFIREDIVGVLTSCIYDKENLPTKLTIVLTIDNTGSVMSAIFPEQNLPASCESQIKEKLLKMKGWEPAIKDEKHVCSEFILPVGCLKWAE